MPTRRKENPSREGSRQGRPAARVSRSQGREARRAVWGERISLAATALAVAGVALFIGYLIGQYAVTLLAEPLQSPALSPGLQRELVQGLENLNPADATREGQAPSAPSPSQRAQAPARRPESRGAATGQGGSVPGGEGTGEAAANQPAPGAWYRVRVGDFSSRAELDRVAARLQEASYPVLLLSGPPYRIQVGAFREEDRARSLVEELKAKGFTAYIAR